MACMNRGDLAPRAGAWSTKPEREFNHVFDHKAHGVVFLFPLLLKVVSEK